MKKIIITLLAVILFLPELSHAQDNRKSSKQTLFWKKLDSCFRLSQKQNIDSVTLFAFNFKLEIKRNKKGETKATHLTANDSLAYDLFPDYKKLMKLNYSEFGNGRSNFTLLIPVLLYSLNNQNNPVINLDKALNSAYALYSPSQFDNRKSANEYLGHLMKLEKDRDKNFEKTITEIIFLPLRTVQIFNLQKSQSNQ